MKDTLAIDQQEAGDNAPLEVVQKAWRLPEARIGFSELEQAQQPIRGNRPRC